MTPLATGEEPAQLQCRSLAKLRFPKTSDLMVRAALLLYLSWILCPIRYFAPTRATADNTWFFALNYAAAHHLVFGRDVVWTWGPFAYLLVPFDVGGNLARGLVFQAALWAVGIVVLWDLFMSTSLPVRNAVLFSLFLAFSSLTYEVYPSNMLLPLALILLVQFQMRGGTARLLGALLLMGLLPLFQCATAVVAAGVLVGFALHRMLRRPAGARREVMLAVFVPSFVAIFAGLFAFDSFADAMTYIKSSQELAKGYAIAMSFSGPPHKVTLALLTLALLLSVLALFRFAYPKWFDFYALILAVPVLFELRHGLVRLDDAHVTQFICFVAFALALLAISIDLRRRAIEIVGCSIVCVFFALWWQGASARNFPHTASLLIGEDTPGRIREAFHYKSLRLTLQQIALRDADSFGLGISIREIVGSHSVGFLSPQYSNALGEHLNLALLPVLQNYSAYTPYLDEFNARWISSRGPEYLAFELLAIDDRHAWTEAPATWAAVYRWYNTRAVGERYLLLQRRSQARFERFELTESRDISFGEVVPIPQFERTLFWTLNCSLSRLGKFRASFLSVPEVTATVFLSGGRARVFRVVLPVLARAAPGNNLPFTLAQYAQVFASSGSQLDSVPQSLRFAGPGTSSYLPSCRLQFLSPQS